MSDAMNLFSPTKRWLRDHHTGNPDNCADHECHCICNSIGEDFCGFCVGILLNNKGDLDIVAFCHSVFHKSKGMVTAHILMHPAESLLVSTLLNWAAMDTWILMPEYRTQLGRMKRIRKKNIRSLKESEKRV
jgi:hypothetical protein